MPGTIADDILTRWATQEASKGALARTHACTAALQALDVARADLAVGSEGAEGTIRRLARQFRRFGRSANLLAFEAWGIQLETASEVDLPDQTQSAITGLRRVLALPRASPSMPAPSVLLVEPLDARARRLETALAAPHRRVTRVRTTEEARTTCRTEVVDVMVMDLGIEDQAGRDLLVELRERMDRTCTVVLAPSEDQALQAEAFALGADLWFPHNTNPSVVAAAVAAQLDRLARAAEVAVRDNLTGLTNRAGFEDAHRRAHAEANRYGEPLSLVLLDLDHFKSVNDVHGHPTGDRVLLGVATVLEERFREGDLVARWGGEEFAILMSRTGVPQAVEAVRTVLGELREWPFRNGNGETLDPVTFSAGAADGRQRLDAAMAEADQHLYRAKQLGRARVEGPGAG